MYLISDIIPPSGYALFGGNDADEAKEMRERIMSSDSYEEALCVIGDYVNITGEDDEEFDEDEDWDMEL